MVRTFSPIVTLSSLLQYANASLAISVTPLPIITVFILLLLENGDEVHRYYISTTATPNKAMCCGSFLDTDDRNIRTCIMKKGLKGTYDVRVIINDKKYETGVKITC